MDGESKMNVAHTIVATILLLPFMSDQRYKRNKFRRLYSRALEILRFNQ